MCRHNARVWAVIACGSIAATTALAQSSGPATPVSAVTPPLVDDASELMLFKDMPVVVAAGKREQLQRQAPASVSVVTDEDIELFGYRSLADVLRNQRGFYLFSDGLNWFAGTRGFLRPGEWNARMLVLVDGRPTHETIFGQSHIDQDFVVPMEAVKRVEIVRGPGSALYGGNAVFSVVDVITKNGADVNGVQLRLQGGTQDTARASAILGTTLANGWDVIGNVTGYTSQGDNNIRYDGVSDAEHNFGHILDSDYEGVESAFLKARKGDFTFQFDYANRYKDNRSATYLASWFDPGSMREERANASVRFDHEVAEDQSIHAVVYYGRYLYDQSWRYADDGAGHPYAYTSEATNDWIGEEIHYDWQVSDRWHLLAGADATQALATEQYDHDAINGPLLDVDASYNTWGLFAEGEYRATDWLTFTGGLRFDHVQRIGSSISPRFAAIFTPTAHDTIKALYGRAFRAPNLYEMFYYSPGANAANPNLRPEICDTYEIVWERQYHGGWRTSVGPYLWSMSNTLNGVPEPDGAIQVSNTGTSRAYGLEGEIQKQWENGGRLRAYGTVTRAEQHGESLTHSPTWIVGASFAIPIINQRTFLALEPQIVGPMKSDLGKYTDPTFITNVVLTSRNIANGLDLQVGVYNIFGEFARLPHSSAADHFQPTLNYPHTQALVTLTYRF